MTPEFDAAFWSSFLIFCFTTSYTPGPNNLLALGNAGTFGFRAAIPLLLGLGSSFIILMSLCGLATSTVAALVPSVILPLKCAGAAYIIWLASKLLRSSSPRYAASARVCSFWEAFGLQFLNFKVILWGITAFTGFILPRTNDPLTIFGFAVMMALMGHSANWCWAAMGGMFRSAFERWGRIINPVLALALLWCIVGFFRG